MPVPVGLAPSMSSIVLQQLGSSHAGGIEHSCTVYSPTGSLSLVSKTFVPQSEVATTISRQKTPLRVCIAPIMSSIVLQQLTSSHAEGREHARTVYSPTRSLSLVSVIFVVESITPYHDKKAEDPASWLCCLEHEFNSPATAGFIACTGKRTCAQCILLPLCQKNKNLLIGNKFKLDWEALVKSCQ